METNGKASWMWRINIASFVLFSLLGATGLMNWLLLPRGYRGGGGIWVLLRHALVEIHQWLALFFIVVIGVHILLHWNYVRKKLTGGHFRTDAAHR